MDNAGVEVISLYGIADRVKYIKKIKKKLRRLVNEKTPDSFTTESMSRKQSFCFEKRPGFSEIYLKEVSCWYALFITLSGPSNPLKMVHFQVVLKIAI